MPKILLIGSTCVDVIIEIDHLPKTAEDIQPKRQTLALGGCAYNAANIVRQSGVPYMFVTPIGTGVYGDYIRKSFQARKLPIHVQKMAAATVLSTKTENVHFYRCMVQNIPLIMSGWKILTFHRFL